MSYKYCQDSSKAAFGAQNCKISPTHFQTSVGGRPKDATRIKIEKMEEEREERRKAMQEVGDVTLTHANSPTQPLCSN